MFYQTGIDITNDKQMFNFLKDHFRYATMNSWNGVYSIANNVKVHRLSLSGDCWTALNLLNNGEYDTLNWIIKDWEREHPGYVVGFNGRSGGYLVLYNADNRGDVLPCSITDNDDNIIKEATPLLKRDKTPLLDDSGNKIYGLDLNNSNYLMPYTSIDNCYAIINQDFDFNCGINPGISSAITSTLFNYCDGAKQTTDLENLDKLFTSELDKNIILTVSDNNFMLVEPIFSLSNNLSYDTNSTINSWKEVCKIVTTTDINMKEYLDNVRKEYEKYLTN